MEVLKLQKMGISEEQEIQEQTAEIKEIVKHARLNFMKNAYHLASSIFDEVQKNYGGKLAPLAAVFLAGYVHGIRVERERRKTRLSA